MLRFALVGCGRISSKHVEALSSKPDSCITAVCDTVAARAEAVARTLGVPHYTDMHDMMASERSRIDALCILTPSGLHADHCVALAAYGKHIVVEKPMALSMADADRMIAACDQAGVRLFVVKQNRYNKPVVKLREALEEGRFGKLVLGAVRVRWSRDQRYYDQDAWRGTWAFDGGVFANQASHHVDLLNWMMGDFESVLARTSNALARIETEDTGAALIRFRNGALGIIEATTATRPKDLEGSISILGEGGTVEIGGFAVNAIKTWSFAQELDSDRLVRAEYSENPPNVYGFGHRKYFEHVRDCIVNDRPALVDGAEGRKSLELIAAIYESAASGQEVRSGFAQSKSKLGRR
jgi:predicted dehydrogenase